MHRIAFQDLVFYNQTMVNKTDIRLLLALEEDGRISYSRLARKLGISVPTVNKRVNALLKNGVFTVHAIPNPFKLGYNSLAVICMDIPMAKVRDVSQKLAKDYCVSYMITTFGRFNLIMVIQFETWEKLYDYISSELDKIIDINGIEAFLVKESIIPGIGFQQYGDHMSSVTEIDPTDKKIIVELSRNGRDSCRNLAKKLGITSSAVSRRLSHLLENDIIRVQAVTNPNKIGYHANASIFMRIDRNTIDTTYATLNAYDEVVTLMKLANGYDLFVNIVAWEDEVLFELVRKIIAETPGITTTEIFIRGEIIKRYYGNSPYWLQQV